MSAPTRARAVGPAAFRSVLGTFCSGMTVITALGPDGPLGFSCHSASSGTPPLGAPRLGGALAWLDRAVTAEYDGGDHTIVVAAVHDLAASPDGTPSLYYRSKYAALDQNGERAVSS
ncbi:flavin reductase family protein [Streptomyces sp. NPDC007157]|uniref:flavin reductase family protein n=1 Tax=Streptomyces sp. NPDC007157 TaxID=3154681 RepID=UPI0034099232